MKTLVVVSLAVIATNLLPAQTVHTVGPGFLPQIRDALAIAAPGDVIHVLPGNYAQFRAQVGVTIRAKTPGTVHILVDPAYSPAHIQFAPPPGQTVHVVSIDFAYHYVSNFYASVQVTSGSATFEDCQWSVLGGPSLLVQNASAHLQDCFITAYEFSGEATGLRAIDAAVTLSNVTIVRQALVSLVGNAVVLIDSTLHGTHVTLFGGYVLPLSVYHSPTWLSDSSLTWNVNSCPILAIGTLPQLDRCVLNSTMSCPPFAPAATLLGVERTGSLQNGMPFGLQFRTSPNGFVAIYANSTFVSGAVPGLLAQPLGIDPSNALYLGIVLADAAGQAGAIWTLPSGAAVVDVPVWFQGVTGLAFPLQISPPAGGTIR